MSQADEERFRELYRCHRETITAYVRRRAPAEAVDDIVADTFLVCWRRRDRVGASTPARGFPSVPLVLRFRAQVGVEGR
jgi:DNA-directed RNA polymerase specialized sigma24 family protein